MAASFSPPMAPFGMLTGNPVCLRRGGKGRKGKGRVGDGGEEEVTVFVCAVCKKDFKSKGQMSNHETSKAHKKKLKVGEILSSLTGWLTACTSRSWRL